MIHAIIFAPYNDEGTLREFHSRMVDAGEELKKSGIAPHFFYVVDGHKKHYKLLLNIEATGTASLLFKKPGEKGLGNSILLGMRNAIEIAKQNHIPDSSPVVRIDSDLEHDPQDIAKLIAAVAGEKHAAIGVNEHYYGETPAISKADHEYNRIIGAVAGRVVFGQEIPQSFPGLNAYKLGDVKKIVWHLAEMRKKYPNTQWGYDTLVAGIASRLLGRKISIVRVNQPRIDKSRRLRKKLAVQQAGIITALRQLLQYEKQIAHNGKK